MKEIRTKAGKLIPIPAIWHVMLCRSDDPENHSVTWRVVVICDPFFSLGMTTVREFKNPKDSPADRLAKAEKYKEAVETIIQRHKQNNKEVA